MIRDLPPITAQGLKSFRDSVAQVDRPDEAPTARSELYHDRRVPNGDLIGSWSNGRSLSPQIPFIADHRGNPVRSSLPPPPVPSYLAPMRRRSLKVRIAALFCVLIALAAVIYWQRNRLNVWFVRDSGVVGQYQITAAADPFLAGQQPADGARKAALVPGHTSALEAGNKSAIWSAPPIGHVYRQRSARGRTTQC